jgi:hypothetical protein
VRINQTVLGDDLRRLLANRSRPSFGVRIIPFDAFSEHFESSSVYWVVATEELALKTSALGIYTIAGRRFVVSSVRGGCCGVGGAVRQQVVAR